MDTASALTTATHCYATLYSFVFTVLCKYDNVMLMSKNLQANEQTCNKSVKSSNSKVQVSGGASHRVKGLNPCPVFVPVPPKFCWLILFTN